MADSNQFEFEPQSYSSSKSSIANFQVEYHPNSGLPSQTMNYYDYIEATNASSPSSTQKKPWWPYFNSRDDFELAELMLEASLTQRQCNKLLDIIQRCSKGLGSVSLSNYSDVQSRWQNAASLLTSVRSFLF